VGGPELCGAEATVVLLHGQPGTAADWSAVAEDLASDYQVVVPDRLGYGRTGGRAAGFSANALAVARLLGRLGTGRALVVGHSWAGGVALALALDFPDRVAGLGLVASVAPGEPLSRVDRLLAKPAVGTALAAAALTAAEPLLSSRPALAVAERRSSSRREALTPLASAWHRPATWNSFAIEQRALLRELPLLGPRLPTLQLPTLVLVGTSDRVVGTAAGNRLAAAISGASLEFVPGGGHLLPQLEPEVVAEALRRLACRALAGQAPTAGAG